MSVMLSPKEAARLLNVGMSRIYALLYAGQIEGHKSDDGSWSIPKSAIDERIEKARSRIKRTRSLAVSL